MKTSRLSRRACLKIRFGGAAGRGRSAPVLGRSTVRTAAGVEFSSVPEMLTLLCPGTGGLRDGFFEHALRFAAVILLALGAFTGCESTDNGSAHSSTSVYYGVGYYDPWYYGHYDSDYDVVVTPPSPGSPPEQGLRPSHPIARPPAVSPRPPMASPRPMPSIPSAPRAMPRGGGRR